MRTRLLSGGTWVCGKTIVPEGLTGPQLSFNFTVRFVGVGVGIIVKQGGSSGGDDALALAISHALHWKLSRSYLFTDVVVLVLSVTYIPRTKIIFSLITVTVSSHLIDWIRDYKTKNDHIT